MHKGIPKTVGMLFTESQIGTKEFSGGDTAFCIFKVK